MRSLPQDGAKRRNFDGEDGVAVCIVGARSLQNELIAFHLEREIGKTCVLVPDMAHIASGNPGDFDPPKLVLLDCWGTPRKNLLRQLRSFGKKNLYRYQVVFYNVAPSQGIEQECVRLGVRGFFYPDDPLEQFIKGVRTILKGELWISREIMTQCILEGPRWDRFSKGSSAILTRRQSEILALVAVGNSNEEIAERLCISPNTVRTHLLHIFKKINVPNRLQAALWAAKNL